MNLLIIKKLIMYSIFMLIHFLPLIFLNLKPPQYLVGKFLRFKCAISQNRKIIRQASIIERCPTHSENGNETSTFSKLKEVLRGSQP